MVGGSGSDFDTEHPVEFPCELRHKLRSSVGDDPSGESVELPDVLDEEAGGSGSRDGDEGRYDMRCFSHGINNHHYGVMSGGLRKFDDEVHAYSVPWSVGDREGTELSDGLVPLGFGLDTHVAGRGVFPDIPGHLWPPIVSRNQL